MKSRNNSGKSLGKNPDSKGAELKEVLWPPMGFIYDQEFMLPAFCKPKLCPLKSVTLDKLEKMQREALEKLKEQASAAAPASDETKPTDKAGTEPIKTDIWKADESET